jgi:hypothetical protein
VRGQLNSAHSGQGDICEHQMNGTSVTCGDTDGLLRASSREDRVADFFQGAVDDLEWGRVIFDDQVRL